MICIGGGFQRFLEPLDICHTIKDQLQNTLMHEYGMGLGIPHMFILRCAQ